MIAIERRNGHLAMRETERTRPGVTTHSIDLRRDHRTGSDRAERANVRAQSGRPTQYTIDEYDARSWLREIECGYLDAWAILSG